MKTHVGVEPLLHLLSAEIDWEDSRLVQSLALLLKSSFHSPPSLCRPRPMAKY